MTTTRDPLAVLRDGMVEVAAAVHDPNSPWEATDNHPSVKRMQWAIAQVEALVEGMRDVLNVGRGTSGRIILELDDEARARECLAPFTPGQDSEGGGRG